MIDWFRDFKHASWHPDNAMVQALATFLLVTLPWLNPFSPGPTPAVVPLLFSWFCMALLLLVWTSTARRWPDAVRAVAIAWLAAALLSALIGLLQYFGLTDRFWPWINSTSGGMAFGNLRQRNHFASLMNIGLVALLWAATHWPERNVQGGAWPRRSWQMVLAVAMGALIGAGNAASSSRTGLFALLQVTGMTLYWWHRTEEVRSDDVPKLLFAVVFAYGVATVALPWLAGLDPTSNGAWARLRAGDPVCASRLTLWRNVLYLIAQKPWVGWGWGELDYAHFITLYPGERFCDILDNAHNLPLHLAVEFGVPVALAVCGAGAWLVWLTRPWQEKDRARQMAWAILAVILLHSLLEYPLWYGPFQMAAVLCVAFLWRKSWASNRPLTPVYQAFVAISFIAICSFAALQYHRASQIYLSPGQRAAAYREDTLNKTRDVLIFQNQVRFAELTTTDLTVANAPHINRLAKDMLHFSPEAVVVESIVDSALLLRQDAEAQFYLARYQAAFPKAYANWVKLRLSMP